MKTIKKIFLRNSSKRLSISADTLTQSEIAEVLSLGFKSNETTGIDDGIENTGNSKAEMTSTGNSAEGRNTSCTEDDKAYNDGKQIGVSDSKQITSKQSLASQKLQRLSGFLKVVDANVDCSSSKNAEDVDKGGQKQRKRKREDETMADVSDSKDGDGENDMKRCKSSKEPRKTQGDKTASEQVMNPNSEATNNPIRVAPISTTKDSDSTPVNDVETPQPSSLSTPSRSSNLSRNSSAFLTPASERRQPGRPRKPSAQKSSDGAISASKKIPSRNLKKGLNSTLDSYFTGEPSETPARRQQRASGKSSFPGTPKDDKNKQQSSSKKGVGIKRNKKGETVLHTACIKVGRLFR